MFIDEFGKNITSQELNSQLEGVYKWRLNLSEMSEKNAFATLNKVNSKINNIKNSSLSHNAEKNPQYMEALLVSQVLETWLNERATMIAERTLSSSELKKREKYAKGMKKVKGDFEKRYPGRGEEVMYATANKMAKKESVEEAMDLLKSVLAGSTQLNESEVDQASVIVAARGMVDEIQKMVEKIGAMINEELPSLMDAIRDRVGVDQASAFNQAAQSALTPLMDAVKGAREAMDNAARQVAGEQPIPMDMGSVDATAAPAEEPASPTEELPEIPRADDEIATSDAASGGSVELGRSKRA